MGSWVFLTHIPDAQGQGSGFDESRSVLFENTRLSVTLDMRPVFIEEGEESGSVLIRLREVNTDSTVEHVTFNIKLDRAGELLFEDRFHSHDGIVALELQHSALDSAEILGERDTLYDAVLTSEDSPAIIRGPILEGGLYHYQVEVISLKEYENRLEQPLMFDLYANIGKTLKYEVSNTEGEDRTLFIKTYYDLINELEYDSTTRTVMFSMPLNWNVNYLSQVPFVHEEVQIPREFEELMSNSYLGTLNGVELSNREVIMDDYSYENIRTVHFVVPKEKLITIAERIEPTEDVAVFTLAPREVPKFPLEILSGQENFLLQISWNPAVIEPGQPTKFIVTIRDPQTLAPINHATANFILLKDGKEIFRQHHTAPIGAIVQDYTFTDEQTGNILLLLQDINGTGESAPMLISVIPEFPLGALITLVAVVSIFVAATRIKRLPLRLRFD